jgi:Chaperone of endosialidase
MPGELIFATFGSVTRRAVPNTTKDQTMIQTNKLPLFIIVFALISLALLAPVKAVDPTDTFYGNGAGNPTTTGTDDSAFGASALHNVTTGNHNTATGSLALFDNTTGTTNTASGWEALQHNTIGNNNTASGGAALWFNTSGSDNTASGNFALLTNTTGGANTATGSSALFSNTTGNSNTATGSLALVDNTTGQFNTASGSSALANNTTGYENTATGSFALLDNTTGYQNTAAGSFALWNNTTGSSNIALGYNAGSNLTTGSNNIDVGNLGIAGEADTIRIGTGQSKCFIAGIYGTLPTSTAPVPVYIDSAGQLGAKGSSRRFKREIRPMDTTSEAILSLKPVTFHYKDDQTNTAQFGLIAEEVGQVNPDLVVRDKDGQIYSVRYDAVDAMLLNEFLKEHRKVEQLRKDFESKVAEQQKQIEALTAGLQKVSAQLALSKIAPQTVRNQ